MSSKNPHEKKGKKVSPSEWLLMGRHEGLPVEVVQSGIHAIMIECGVGPLFVPNSILDLSR
jgi:hypothetical protein